MDSDEQSVDRSLGLSGRVSRRQALTRLGLGGGAAAILGAGGARALAAPVNVQVDESDADEETAEEALIPTATRESLPESDAESAGRLRVLIDEDRSLWLDNGHGWASLTGERFNVRAFGAVGDGVADDWGAFNAAIEAMVSVFDEDSTSPFGRTLLVPPGHYRLAQTLVLDRAIRLEGASIGSAYGDSFLLFDEGIIGIVVAAAEPNRTGAPGRRGDGSVIEHLRLEAAGRSASGPSTPAAEGGSPSGAHGIWLQASATVRDCSISAFAGDGVHIEGTGEAIGPWLVTESRVQRCGGNGLGIIGAGAGGGTALGVSAVGNDGWAIADDSTEGNVYLHCRADGNGLGAFQVAGNENGAVVVGCSSEQGQPRSSFSPVTLVVGGNHGAGYEGGNAWTAGGSRMNLLAQEPGSGSEAIQTVPTLQIEGSADQSEPHLRVLGSDGAQQVTVDATGRLLLGQLPEGRNGSAEGDALLLQISHAASGTAGVRWVSGDETPGWVAQARAYLDVSGPDAPDAETLARLTFQTPDAGGAELDTLTLSRGAVGVGTTQPGAALHVESTTSGFLPPRMTGDQRDAIAQPVEGLLIYNVSTHRLNLFVDDGWREIDLAPVGG